MAERLIITSVERPFAQGGREYAVGECVEFPPMLAAVYVNTGYVRMVGVVPSPVVVRPKRRYRRKDKVAE
jgi:hypothetical protein